MKILVCGGRSFGDGALLKRVLDSYFAKHQPLLIIEGGALGADLLARNWARDVGVHFASVEANWRRYGRGAGPKRNAAMLLLEPDLVLAFPGGDGTADMVSKARDVGIEVKEIRGEVALEGRE